MAMRGRRVPGSTLLRAHRDLRRNGRTAGCCYPRPLGHALGAKNQREFFAEATALYLSPLPTGSGSQGDGNGVSCRVLTPEAREVMEDSGGLLSVSGAELIEHIHPDLYALLQALYGPPPQFEQLW